MKAILFLLLTFIIESWTANLCPAKESIAPCTCQPGISSYIMIICSGQSINEGVLTNIFGNKIISNNTNKEIYLRLTSIVKLSKSQFGSNVFSSVSIINNLNLASIEADTFQLSGSRADALDIYNNPKLILINVVDVIHNFSNLKSLHLSINGDIPDRAFEPRSGSSFGKNLRFIQFYKTNTTSIGSYAFNNLPKLITLDFSRNKISKIKSNGLTFKLNQISQLQKLNVYLERNNLTENSFTNTSIQNKNGTRVILRLGYNKINYLPEQVFKPYVYDNAIQIVAKPLNITCDCRMKWMLDLPMEYKASYHYVDCKNFKNKNIYHVKPNDLKCN